MCRLSLVSAIVRPIQASNYSAQARHYRGLYQVDLDALGVLVAYFVAFAMVNVSHSVAQRVASLPQQGSGHACQ